ncbi:hypothetical protein D3C74_262240 [compost metagenome]
MTQNASASRCPSSRIVEASPSHALTGSVGCACSSWPRAGCTVTSWQSIWPSSASVTSTFHGRTSFQRKKLPFGGAVIVTTGLVLPTTIGTVAVPVLADSVFSVTVRRASKLPLVV